MHKETLVLNKAYQPINIIDWKSCATNVFSNKSIFEVLVHYEHNSIRTIDAEYKLPAVIRTLRYVRPVINSCSVNKTLLYKRDSGTCQYCYKSIRKSDATIDHIIPKSRSGGNTWTNLVISCYDCNNYKGNRTPEEAGMLLMKAPKTPAYLIVSKKIPIEWLDFLYFL